MKRIIEGKRYDTDKADFVARASSNVGRSDYGWWREELYQTQRSRAFFLAGEGNARSHYATNLGGGSWGPGEKITPLTPEQAFAWAESHLPASEVESLFPHAITDA